MGGAAVATHVCRAPLVSSDGEPRPGAFCNELLVLCRQKIEGKGKLGPYVTTKVIAHCSKKHQGTEVAAAAAAKAKALEMLVLLRINRDFMEYMRATYPHLSLQQFNMTVSDPAADADGETGGEA
jgi:hypothetical protein